MVYGLFGFDGVLRLRVLGVSTKTLYTTVREPTCSIPILGHPQGDKQLELAASFFLAHAKSGPCSLEDRAA